MYDRLQPHIVLLHRLEQRREKTPPDQYCNGLNDREDQKWLLKDAKCSHAVSRKVTDHRRSGHTVIRKRVQLG